MKKGLLFACFTAVALVSAAQDAKRADQLVEEGIALHDEQQYEQAIQKYKAALEADKNNFYAMAEMAYSLLELSRYDETITLCEQTLALHPNAEEGYIVYITLGNAYDLRKEPKKALAVYEEGIAKFPVHQMLRFNKGITLIGMDAYDLAMIELQQSAKLNPDHAGTNNSIGRLAVIQKNNIAGMLALLRFFAVEPTSNRAAKNLELLELLLQGNVEETSKGNITINLPAETVDSSGAQKTDDFRILEISLALSSALDYDDKYKKESKAARLQRKLEVLIESLETAQKEGQAGFFWDYYVPYFIELKRQEWLPVFAHIVYASGKDDADKKWIAKHPKEIEQFFNWSEVYEWPR